MTFASVESTWLVNTTSRQAFYQTFLIDSSLAGQCALIHYGRLSRQIERDHRPINGGTVKMHSNKGLGFVATKIAEKTNSDYRQVGLTERKTFEMESEFRGWLTHTFGAAHRDEILMVIGMKVLHPFDEIPAEGGVIIPSIPVEDICSPEIKERPETWGSW